MSSETVHALKRAGCEEVWMGAESGSQTILDAMDKGLTVASIREARARLGEAGIRAAFFLQFGYPGETLSEIESTIALVRTTQPDDIGISVSYPLPGTVFYQRVHAQLGVKRNWIDSDDLTAMFRAAYTDAFYRSVRNALHFEVEQYRRPSAERDQIRTTELWDEVYRLEKSSRNAMPTQLTVLPSASTEPVALCTSGGCK
jgi:radical SAM superfamily enzyme YgiQ (UPF0313 family)